MKSISVVICSLLFLYGCNERDNDSVLYDTESAYNVSVNDYRNHDIILQVPSENFYKKIPAVPISTGKRLGEGDKFFENAYDRMVKTLEKLKSNGVIDKIKKISSQYNIRPIHVLGAITGEHTFNVSISDNLQNAYIWTIKHWVTRFESGDHSLADIIAYSEFDKCHKKLTEYERWECITNIWNMKFRGKTIHGASFENRGLKWAFFNPKSFLKPGGIGLTYGLGQMGPERVLMLTDIVSEHSNNVELSVENPSDIYSAILDVDSTIHYIAASVFVSIKYYRDIANFDISDNVGVTSTLYNLGYERMKAKEIFDKNMVSIKDGNGIIYPVENYYGWYMNQNIKLLQEALAD